MDQRRRSLLLGLAAIGAAPPAIAQQANLPRIALLDPTEEPTALDENNIYWGRLLKELRSLGRIEGKTLKVERWSGRTDAARYPDLARKVAESRPDVIVAFGFTMISEMAKAARTIPIVGIGTIPQDARQSFAKPGGNVTGLHTSFDQELYVKHAEFMREVTKPGARIAWLGLQHHWDGMLGNTAREGARRMKLEIQPAVIASPVSPSTVRAAFATKAMKADGLYLAAAIELRPQRFLIGQLATAARLPSVGGFVDDADAGLLLSYGADNPAAFQRAAHYVDRILNGAKAGDIPIELPTKATLVINRRTAKALGITLSQELIVRADRVID